MKKIITSYFILILYIAFSVGVVIEEHNHCTVCEDGKCEIELFSSQNHDSGCEGDLCEIEKHHHENHCNCKIEEFKLKADYTSEEKVKITSAKLILLSFVNTYFNNNILKPNINSSLIYLITPDKRLFHKLSVIQLSSILC